MYSNTELDNYKLQVELLQQKLQKSEENRAQLEKELDHIQQQQIDYNSTRRKKHRRQFEQFLEEQKQHSLRNQLLLQTLNHIDQHAKALAERTDQLRKSKLQYELQLMHQTQNTQTNITTTTTAAAAAATPITVLVPTAAVPAASAIASVPLASLPATTTDKNTNHNSVGPRFEEVANLTTCQWTLAMATPLTTGMLLMPTATVIPHLRPPSNENLYDHQRKSDKHNDDNTNNNNDNTINKNNNMSINGNGNGSGSGNENENEKQEEKHEYENNNQMKVEEKFEKIVKTVNRINKFVTNDEIIEEPKEIENVDFIKTDDITTYEEYLKKKNNILPEEEEGEEEEEKVVDESSVIETSIRELNLSSEQTKMNIENIENAIYGELVSPLQEMSAYENENIEKSSYDGIDDYNYEPTLVTTEAELYPQRPIENLNQQQDDMIDYQQQNQQQQQLQQHHQQAENGNNEYENVEYADYTGNEYDGSSVYAENTEYPGYTYDETTGQYTPNEQMSYTDSTKLNEFEYEQSDQSQIPSDYAYNNSVDATIEQQQQQQENLQEKPEDELLQNTISSNINTDNVLTNTTSNSTPSITPNTQKLVKPILANTTNDTQKKKKRVNFLDSSDTDESTKASKTNINNLDTINNVVSSESDFDFSTNDDKKK